MSTHNICFHGEIRKILCGFPLLSGAMDICLFDLGLTSLSTFFSHIATVSGCGAQCSLLECCLTEISRPRHLT